MKLKTAIEIHGQFENRIANEKFKSGARTIGQLFAGLNSVVEKRNPNHTDDTHILRVANSAKAMIDKINKVKEGIDASFADQISAVVEARMKKVPLAIVNEALAREIRDRVAAMPRPDAEKLMMSFVTQNMAAELAALTQVPGFLANLTDEDQARYRDLIFSTHAADELAAEAALMADYENAKEACSQALSVTLNYTNQADVGRIIEAEALAKAADEQLSSTLAE